MKQFYSNFRRVVFSLLCPFSAVAQGVLPSNFLCESKPNLIGISETSPGLICQLSDNVHTGTRAMSDRLPDSGRRCATTAGVERDLWDSGRVTTNETSQIAYAGSEFTFLNRNPRNFIQPSTLFRFRMP